MSPGPDIDQEAIQLANAAALDPVFAGELVDAAMRMAVRRWEELDARPEQLLPGLARSVHPDAAITAAFLILAARGAGKSLAGAMAVLSWACARDWPGWRAVSGERGPIFLVIGPNFSQTKRVLFEGTLLPLLVPGALANWNRSSLELTLWNGVIIQGVSAESAENVLGYKRRWRLARRARFVSRRRFLTPGRGHRLVEPGPSAPRRPPRLGAPHRGHHLTPVETPPHEPGRADRPDKPRPWPG